MHSSRRSRSGTLVEVVGGLLAAGLAFSLGLALRRLWAGLLDEGFILALADAIDHGRVLYRDVYVDAPFPGIFYTLAGVFSLFGSSVEVSRIAEAVAFAAAAGAVFVVTRRLADAFAGAAAAVLFCSYRIWAFPHWHVAHYSTFAALFLLLALLVLTGDRRRSGAVAAREAGRERPAIRIVNLGRRTWSAGPPGMSRARLWIAGCLIGTAVWYKQNTGLGALAALHPAFAIVAACLARRGRLAQWVADWFRLTLVSVFWLDLGVATMSAPIVLALWRAGALNDFYFQTVIAPLSKALDYPYLGMPPLTSFGQDPVVRARIADYLPSVLITVAWESIAESWLYRETALPDTLIKLVFWLPYAVTAAMAAVVAVATARSLRITGPPARDPGRRPIDVAAWTFTLALTAAALLAFNPPHDWIHLMMVYPWTIIVAAALVGQAIARVRVRFVRRALVGASLAAVVAAAASSVWLAQSLRATLSAEVDFPPRAEVRLRPEDASVLRRALDFAGTAIAPERPLAALPYFPWLNFAADRPLLGSYAVVWPLQDAAVRDANLIDALERDRTQTLLVSLAEFPYLGLLRTNAPALFAHLVKYYRSGEVFTENRSGLLFVALHRRSEPVALPGEVLVPAPGVLRLRLDGPEAAPSPGTSATEELWPYAAVIAEPPPQGEEVARVAFRLTPDAGAVLRGSVAADPAGWLSRRASALEATITVHDDDGPTGGDGVVFRRRLAPALDAADRTWVDFDVDLSRFAHRPVTLTLESRCTGCAGLPFERIGWAELRVEARP